MDVMSTKSSFNNIGSNLVKQAAPYNSSNISSTVGMGKQCMTVATLSEWYLYKIANCHLSSLSVAPATRMDWC